MSIQPTYNSSFKPKKQSEYLWAQSQPLSFSTKKNPTFINGRRQKHKSFYHSRQSHIALSQEFARCAEYRLSELNDEFTIFKGNVMNPLKSKIQWAEFFKQFNNSRRNYEYNHKVKICFLLKAHITKSNSPKQRDDIHYDYVAFTDANLAPRELSKLINRWIQKAGGRSKCECKMIHDRSPKNISRITDYVMKATGSPHYLPLPELARHKLITKTLGDFWGRKKQSVTMTRYMNGEKETNKRELSARKQVWYLWCRSIFGNDIPKYETSDFITQKKVLKTASKQLSRGIRVIGSCSAYNFDTKKILNTAITTVSGIFFTPQKTEENQAIHAVRNYSYIGDIDEQMERHLKPSPELQNLYYVGFRGRLFEATDGPLVVTGEQLNRLLDNYGHRVELRRMFDTNRVTKTNPPAFF